MLLDPWEVFCEKNWLRDDGGAFPTEARVKIFLDNCAYILLRDNPEGTLSHYKEIVVGSHEIPVSSCPACIDETISGGHAEDDESEESRFTQMLEKLDAREATLGIPKPKKKPRVETKFQRTERVREAYPGCTFAHCRVDTTNRFEHDGVWYVIDEWVAAYQPKETKEGLLYDMDTVVVVSDAEGVLHFYDQAMRPIDRSDIQYA